MLKTFTSAQIMSSRGCYDREKVNTLSFISKSEITINDILDSEIPLKDKRWFLFNSCELTLIQKKWLCIDLAEAVLEIYENKYPDNKAPREAVQAAKDYLNNIITRDGLLTKRAAYAYAYAYAAYAAYAAADAAYAAYAAAAYAADAAAAYAAAAYAYAAADAADDDNRDNRDKNHYQTKLLNILKEFVKNN